MRGGKFRITLLVVVVTAAGLAARVALDDPVPGSTAHYRSLPARYLDCGLRVDERPVYTPMPAEMRRCLADAFVSCRPAKQHSVGMTMEGDRVYGTTLIEPAPDGTCRVHLYSDSRADRFASAGLSARVCTAMAFDAEQRFRVSGCTDERERDL